MNILSQGQTLLSTLEPPTIALLCVVFVGPVLFLHLVSAFFDFPVGSMILDYLGLSWLWGDGDSKSERRSSGRKSKGIRRRADVAHEGSVSKGCYPGLVNISGTYCFFNSTVQAFASLKALQPQIEEIHKNAEDWDVPTPVLDALRSVLIDLNTPHRRPSSFRPSEVIKALSDSGPGKRSALFSSREHQDAQELFQLLSSVVRDEAGNVLQERMKERGLGGFATEASTSSDTDIYSRSVFDGLMAQRRSCVDCGYTEAVRHFAFDNISLTVPPLSSTSLYQCLQDYTRLEILEDCLCSNCSMVATHNRLLAEIERQNAPETNAIMPGDREKPKTTSKKKRERETRKFEELVRKAIADRKVEEEIKGLKMEKVYSKRSTKQVMIARAPPVLALHLQRSAFFGRAVKNPCRVSFPEYLDITSFSTSGQLSTAPTLPISQPTTPIATPVDGPHFHFPTVATNGIHFGPNSQLFPPKSPTSPTASNTAYRLAAVVCHYGAHSYGHYVTFRRVPGDRWIRASDSDVAEVSLREVLSETMGTFMLYYERIDEKKPDPEEKVEEEPKTSAVAAPSSPS
ncbi:ubiquitin carboxyl-terminal hydrolase [Ceratobasidium sp. AG-Ba]|nr:ubiquitin carboxyl-terminal hydrolase [Ceratobasidium sp. AG-Ba]QRW01857.1 ubiquitin carboxyl-terminal hydrolase [Ceratobasidium sp. AG-Ba]